MEKLGPEKYVGILNRLGLKSLSAGKQIKGLSKDISQTKMTLNARLFESKKLHISVIFVKRPKA